MNGSYLLPSATSRTSRAMARLLVITILSAVGAIALIGSSVTSAWASHFRAGELSWARSSATTSTVTFTMTESFRRNFNGWVNFYAYGGGSPAAPNAGDIVQDGNTRVYFGDGGVINPYLEVTTVDAANNVLTVEAVNAPSTTPTHLTHTYASATGNYTAKLTGCCRLGSPTDTTNPGGHLNNPDKSTAVATTVNLSSGNLTSVSSSLPPIIDCPRNSPCNFTIPVSLPAGQSAVYSMSSAAEAVDLSDWPGTGSFVQPTGAAVSAAGLFTWSTTGQPLAPSTFDTYYSAQVKITSQVGTTTMSSVAVDFFLRITAQTNNPPAFVDPTPADGTVYNVAPGDTVNFTVAGKDPDTNQTVALGVTNKPSDATFTPVTTGNPASSAFSWTPSSVGSAVLNLTVADQFGLGTTPRSVTIVVAKRKPGIDWSTPASIVYGTALDAQQLDAAISASGPQPPHPGTFSYSPDTGSVLTAGDRTLSVTWDPDTSDATGWDSTTATVTLRVNKATQTLSFDPAIDPTTTYAYGDPPFSVTAVSDAGLPVTYGVGTLDACTQTPQPDGSTTVAVDGAGSCTLTADAAGDANHEAATQLSHSFTFEKQTPSLTLSPADSTYGTPFGARQEAGIAPAEAGTDGTISYLVDGVALPADGILPAGDHTVTAVYTPDATTGGNFNATSKDASWHIGQAPQSIDFAALTDRTVGDAAFPVTATSSSGLAVTFSSASPTTCSVTTDGQVTVQHAGSCTIDADQIGDNNYLPAPTVSQSFNVDKASQTVVFTPPPTQTYGGHPVALTATGGASGLPVTFVALPSASCSVDGANNLYLNGAGTCTITASQDGNGDYYPAPDVVRTVTIAKATPHLTWSTPAPVVYGTPLGTAELNATVIEPVAGDFTYTLTDGTTPATGAVLNASTTPQTLNALFTPTGGDEDNWNSATTQTTIIVKKADQTITWTQVRASATYGDLPFQVAATGGGSGNPVTFAEEPGSTCTVSTTTVTTVTITGAGSCVINADQPGSANYNPAPTSQRSVNVAQQTPTIAWSNPAHITYGTALSSTQLNATVSPSEAAANGGLSYETDAATGDATGQLLHAGTHTLTATYTPGSSGAGLNYTGATKTATLVVDQASQTITGFAAIDTQTYGDGPLTLSATGGASGKPVYFTVDPGSSCATTGTHGATLTLTGVGSCTVVAHQDGSADYNAAPDVPQSFTINQAPQTITFAPLSDGYVGDSARTLTATGGGSGNPVTFAAGPSTTCTATATGILTTVGPGVCSVTASQAGNSNYLAATPVTRTFKIAYRICVLFDQKHSAQSGSTIPIKVALCNAGGLNTSTSSVVLHATGVDTGAATAAGNSQPGNNFRFTAGSTGSNYQYNLQTTGLASGTHNLYFTVGADPTTHAVSFTIT